MLYCYAILELSDAHILGGIIIMKRLVAYFSASKTTEKVANMIAEEGGYDICEITPKEAYTKADLNWMDKKSRSSVDMSQYDEFILGFPIWWYVAPTIVNTFLEKYDFSGKKIILFATSGGSGFGNTVKELQPSAPNSEIVEGKLLNRATKQEIADWIKEI